VASNQLSSVADQRELVLARRAEPNDMPIEIVRRQKHSGAAFALACQSCGLDDKEIYGALNLDAGYFSRIKKGEATLQGDLIGPFCTVVNNRIFAEWIAFQTGCTLVQIQSEAERLLALEREKNKEKEAENRLLRQLVVGRAAA
jgi:hypothetical protein